MRWREVAVLVGLLAICGCEPGGLQEFRSENESLEREIKELRLELEEKEQRLASAKEAIETISSLADDLEFQVNRFGYDDWRDVVPELPSLADDISSLAEETLLEMDRRSMDGDEVQGPSHAPSTTDSKTVPGWPVQRRS
jgi:hypothetical protein